MSSSRSANERAKKEMLKVFTTIPNDFIQSYHRMMNMTSRNPSFPVDMDTGARWLKVDRDDLVDNIKRRYKQNIHYIVTKNPRTEGPGGRNREKLFMTKEAFKHVCLKSTSPMGEKVRDYFIQVEELTTTYAPEFKQAIENTIGTEAHVLQNTDYKDTGRGFIYAIRSGKKGHVRFGMTRRGSLIRLKEHNSARARKLRLLMDIEVDKRREVERCLHLILKNKHYLGEDPKKPEGGEIYQVDIHILRKLVKSCAQLTNRLQNINLDDVDEREQLYILFLNDDPAEKREADKLIDWNMDPVSSCMLRDVPSRCAKKAAATVRRRRSAVKPAKVSRRRQAP